MAEPLPQETVDAILADIRAGGMSCRQIGRKHSVSHSKVSTLAKSAGLTFDRAAQTATGTAAAKFDAKAARQTAIQGLYEDANHFRHRALSRYEVIVTTMEGPVHVWLEEPPAREVKDFTSARVQLVTLALKLEQHDNDGGGAQAKSMINDLFGAFNLAYYQAAEEDRLAEAKVSSAVES